MNNQYVKSVPKVFNGPLTGVLYYTQLNAM